MNNLAINTIPKKIFSAIFFLLLFFFLASYQNKAIAIDQCTLTTNPASPIIGKPDTLKLEFDLNPIKQLLNQGSYGTGGTLFLRFPQGYVRPFFNYFCPDYNIVPVVGDFNNIVNNFSIDLINNNNNNIYGSCNFYQFAFDDENAAAYSNGHPMQIIYKLGELEHPLCIADYSIIHDRASCDIAVTHTGIGDVNNATWSVEISNIKIPQEHIDKVDPSFGYIAIEKTFDNDLVKEAATKWISGMTNIPSTPIPTSIRTTAGDHNIVVYEQSCSWVGICTRNQEMKRAIFNIGRTGQTPIPTQAPPTPNPTCKVCYDANSCGGVCLNCPRCGGGGLSDLNLIPICESLPAVFKTACGECQKPGSEKIWTAIGCMPISATGFVKQYIFTYGVGIAGGFAFLYFLFAAFTILTSAGNPEKIEEAKQMIISSLSGLLLIIFSVVLLKIIGVDILQIPGWSTTAPPTPTPTSMHIPPGGLTTPTPKLCSGECVKLSETCQSGYTPDSSKQCDSDSISRGYKKCCEPLPTSSPKPTRSGVPTDSPSTSTPTPLHTPTPFPTHTENTCSDPNGIIVGCPIVTSKPCFSGGGNCKVSQQCDGADKDGKCNYFCYNSETKLTPCDSSQNVDENHKNDCRFQEYVYANCPRQYPQNECEDYESCQVYQECGYINNGNWCQYFCYNSSGKQVSCNPPTPTPIPTSP